MYSLIGKSDAKTYYGILTAAFGANLGSGDNMIFLIIHYLLRTISYKHFPTPLLTLFFTGATNSYSPTSNFGKSSLKESSRTSKSDEMNK